MLVHHINIAQRETHQVLSIQAVFQNTNCDKMCYSVLVIEESCHRGHTTKATACWRQCQYRAYESSESGHWDNLCTNRVIPQNINNMFQIWHEGHEDVSGERICQACKDIADDPDIRELMDKMRPMEVKEMEHRHALEEIRADSEAAPRRFAGHELGWELDSLQKSEEAVQLKQLEAKVELNRLERQYNDVAYPHIEANEDQIVHEALEFLNTQLSADQINIYMGPVDAEERANCLDWPRALAVADDDEVWPCDILTY